MKLIIPPRLRKSETIGFVSPSAGLAPFAMHRIKKATQMFQELGYKVKIGKNALKNAGYVSASVEERVDDIDSMFRDREVKMIICTIGGNHSNQLLKYLDYGLIKKNPKIFLGYSDITILHFAFQSQANLATFYGPCAMTQFGEYPKILDYTLDYFNKALVEEYAEETYEIKLSKIWTDEVLDWFKKKDLKRPRKYNINTSYEWIVKGEAKGEVLGGVIPSINRLAGTKYWIDPAEKIYFIDIPESNDINKGLPVGEVDAYFADLDNLGLFDSIKALIVGRPYRYSKEEIIQLKKLIKKYAGNKGYPVLFNVNIGHVDPIITLRYGASVELNSALERFMVIN